MKCPNIWCYNKRWNDKGGCVFYDNCQLRKNYETEFCPTDNCFGCKDYGKDIDCPMWGDRSCYRAAVKTPKTNCNSCGSVCVEPEKDSEGNVICPEEENNNE